MNKRTSEAAPDLQKQRMEALHLAQHVMASNNFAGPMQSPKGYTAEQVISCAERFMEFVLRK